MIQILFALHIFLQLIKFIIIIEVILSWWQMFWLNININFIKNITWPIYNKIKKIIPTTFWMIDFTPILVIIILEIIDAIIIGLYPSILYF